MSVRKNCNNCGHLIGVFKSGDELPALCERCSYMAGIHWKAATLVLWMVGLVGGIVLVGLVILSLIRG